ncbi:NAD(P)H-quinone oxidoreductase [Micropruina sonneratiae]|uniref:NAD(P)H-quinone oxidoreductase n=1 Tax=Micropruina sonneratiae TaxID=2986940 RepID=UPI0022261EE6|nr:NAD(P)H-quinone oxidoreductase [Micropruina sp. KQZ13P-5]MCW3159133.1 NAD(P)H-quinone oxidoreductase [Micropruina sp. KQZ13P-5]
MRAVVTDSFGDPDVLRLSEVPDPVPEPGEVLIRVMASGVNRADLLQRQGHYPPPPGITDIIGLEVSGVISAVGTEVTGWSPGDECVALLAGGGYAEYVAVPAGQVVRPPEGIDLVTSAGLIEVAATVTSNLTRVALRPGEILLVHGGTGGIGTFAIQYARALGCRVFATAGNTEKLDLCRDLGAEASFDYHDDWLAAVRGASAGHGADVILDVIGAKYLPSNVEALADDGRLVVIGMQGGRKGTLDLGTLLAKRALVIATSLRGRPVEQKAAICAEVARSVWPLYTDGRIRPAAETRFAIADVAAAHRHLASGDAFGKLILTW